MMQSAVAKPMLRAVHFILFATGAVCGFGKAEFSGQQAWGFAPVVSRYLRGVRQSATCRSKALARVASG